MKKHLYYFVLRFVELIGNIFPSYYLGNRIRGILYKLFFKKCGKNLQVDVNVKLSNLYNIELGDNIYIGYGSWIHGGFGKIIIESDVIISPYVVMVPGNHKFNGLNYRYLSDDAPGEILIKYGSWIASHSVILKNTVIGESSVVGALSLVNGKYNNRIIIGTSLAKKIKELDEK